MDMEYWHGMMVDHIKDNIYMIGKMGMESLNGQMEENILEIGKMANNMEEDSIVFKMDKLKLENG